MAKSRHRFPQFDYCTQCKLLAEAQKTKPSCPAQNIGRLTPEKLSEIMERTPYERWRTPDDIAKIFNYSSKQIIRIVSNPNNNIACDSVDGRWFICYCSISEYMQKFAQDDLDDTTPT